MKGRDFPWSRLLLVLLIFTAGFFLHDVQTHGSFQGTPGRHRIGIIQPGKILWEHQASPSTAKASTVPCPHMCHTHMAFKSPKGWRLHHCPG